MKKEEEKHKNEKQRKKLRERNGKRMVKVVISYSDEISRMPNFECFVI